MRLIDGDALAEVLNEMVVEWTEFGNNGLFAHGIRKGLNDAYRATINFPTLDYAPVKRGERIMVYNLDGMPCGSKCSNCGRRVRNAGENYCPRCGALMDGKEE